MHVIMRFALILSVIAFADGAWAELRVWTDVNGKTIEAEHVRTLSDIVVLRQADKTEIRVSLDTLCERDRQYAVLQTPPRIDISVSADADRSNTDYGNRRMVQEETVSVQVKIRKSSPAPYEAPLTAELYLIGLPEQKEGYYILDKSTEHFSFSSENNYQHIMVSSDIKLKTMETGREKGVEYKGYLVAVIDKEGQVLQLKCSKLDYEKNSKAILAGEKGTSYDGEYKIIQRKQKKPSRNPDTFKKKLMPGRRF